MRLKSLMSRRPSAAIVISSAALFMSLGGVGYAAIAIPDNSVGTAQLKNNAVTNSKIKNNAVNYKKINPGSVGIVRANTNQLQVRVSGTCAAGTAIATVNQVGKVTCNNALPSEFGTTNNTAAVTSTAATVSTLTVASNTQVRSVTIDTTGHSGDTSTASIPLQATGPAGTGSVSCPNAIPGNGTAPDTSVTAAINAIQTASNS